MNEERIQCQYCEHSFTTTLTGTQFINELICPVCGEVAISYARAQGGGGNLISDTFSEDSLLIADFNSMLESIEQAAGCVGGDFRDAEARAIIIETLQSLVAELCKVNTAIFVSVEVLSD